MNLMFHMLMQVLPLPASRQKQEKTKTHRFTEGDFLGDFGDFKNDVDEGFSDGLGFIAGII